MTNAGREYVVGLPVTVRVSDDGTVRYSVDLDEVSQAILDEYGWTGDAQPVPDPQTQTDAALVDADRERRQSEGFHWH